MSEIQTTLLDFFGFAWWVEISTEIPRCSYYFGPFSKAEDAEVAKHGYIEDLEQEGAQGIEVNVRRCKPSILTLDKDSKHYHKIPPLNRYNISK